MPDDERLQAVAAVLRRCRYWKSYEPFYPNDLRSLLDQGDLRGSTMEDVRAVLSVMLAEGEIDPYGDQFRRRALTTYWLRRQWTERRV